MPQKNPYALPFLNRDMLDFGQGARISLQISLISTLATGYVLRGLTRAGAFQYNFTAAGDGTIETFEYEMSDIPILCGLYADESNSQRPIAHATIHLAVESTKVGILAQGVINTVFGITYPTQLPPNSMQANGAVYAPAMTDPAAGAEMSFSVPNNQAWEIMYFSIKLVTDANAANRTVAFRIQDGTAYNRTYVAGTVQTASQTVTYNFTPNGTTGVSVATNEQFVKLDSPCFIPPLATLSTVTTNKQATDNYSFPDLWVRVHFIDANQ